MMDHDDAEIAGVAHQLETVGEARHLRLAHAAASHAGCGGHGTGTDNDRNVTDAPDVGERRFIERFAVHVVGPAQHRLIERAAHIGVMIAGGDADGLGRPDGLEPVVGRIDLGFEAEIDQIARHRSDIGMLLAHVADEIGKAFAA